MTTDPRERLRRIDPAPVDVEPPSGAIEAVAVIHEIERRMGMKPTESTEPTITSSPQQQEAVPLPSAPDQVLTSPQPRTSPGSRRRLLVGVGALAAALFVGAAVLGIIAASTPVAGDRADPATVLAAYAEARNAGDVDGAVAFYAEDAVVRDHPFDDDGVATGIDEIRALEEQIPAVQGSGEGLEYLDMEVFGSTATFGHSFWYGADGITSGGVDGCSGGVGATATVEGGKITLYDWGEGNSPPAYLRSSGNCVTPVPDA
jgi:hypothetical protein